MGSCWKIEMKTFSFCVVDGGGGRIPVVIGIGIGIGVGEKFIIIRLEIND